VDDVRCRHGRSGGAIVITDDVGIGLRWWRFAERVFVTPAVDQILAHWRGHYDTEFSDPDGVYVAVPYDDGSGRMVRCDAGRFL
jgi:hypothetical protein